MPLYTYICGTLLGVAPVPRPIRFSCVTQDRCVRNLNWAPECRGAAVCNRESRCRVLILRVAAFPTWRGIFPDAHDAMLARSSLVIAGTRFLSLRWTLLFLSFTWSCLRMANEEAIFLPVSFVMERFQVLSWIVETCLVVYIGIY